MVEQSLKKAGGVLLDPGLANLPSSLPFNSHLEEDTAVVRVCEPRLENAEGRGSFREFT